VVYNERKDVLIHLCQPPFRFDIDGNGQMIQVGVYRCNGGQPKIGISRQVMKGGQMTPSRLGRLTLDEAEYIFGALNEALKELKDTLHGDYLDNERKIGG
jgi:hypothetical protein